MTEIFLEIRFFESPKNYMEDNPNNLSEDDYSVSHAKRSNAANAYIADYSKNGPKFVSLGKENGYALLRFENEVSINLGTKLQVVETSWNKNAGYASLEAAYAAYPEQADVYILSGEKPRYYSSGLEDMSEHHWVYIGSAGIANNVVDLADIEELEETSFRWIVIVDSESTTPDGYDLNFVSVFNKVIQTE
ncbi:MAG: hypothetical protein CMB80_31445 [Flammeovirgaceae bacterium]|nr:hypothetical protein [Flammeovirgaceae bacterium]MBE61950.1 hypothetical protein [Flammeovirgaceae bacterium]HCX23586.1 hypothetical protein [Cytophagales bacterium]